MIDNNYSASERNKALCRKELDLIQNGNFVSAMYEECQSMSFLKVLGITDFWEADSDISVSDLMADVLCGCVKHNVTYSYALVGDESGISIYIGMTKQLSNSMKSSLEALYPGICAEVIPDNPLLSCPREFGGFFTGIPTNKRATEKKSLQIESICRGMLGKRFTYIVLAVGISNVAVMLGHDKILIEMEHAYSMINQTISGGSIGNITAQKQNFEYKDYYENLTLLEQSIKAGTARGMWRVNGYYASDNYNDTKQLGNIIKASYSGTESKPEPFRVIEYNSIMDVIGNMQMMSEPTKSPDLHPLGQWRTSNANSTISLYKYKYQTLLNSEQLAVLCQLPTKEFPGFYVDKYVEFDVSNRQIDSYVSPIPIGEICIADRKAAKAITGRASSAGGAGSNMYNIEKGDLTRHALIIGITGGGKTNTTKSILSTLWTKQEKDERIPFLVIESAKREYWEMRNLQGFEDLLVFTLGSEAEKTSVKYRINPFESNEGISLQTHIDYLLSTFKAAFDLYPPMPHILETAIYEIYSDRGWDIVESKNIYGATEYPTLSDLYHKIGVVVDNLGYHQEIQSNVKAALQTRIHSLMIGGKGAMLNTPKSVPIDILLSRPVVMELEDLGDDETKSFVIGILLVQLYEYRKSLMIKGSKDLSHVLVIEEAHRLLKNVSESGEGGNTRAKSVEFFCNLLAEIRTFGQGIIIADQIPTKLASDTLKNTNLKIVHRTVAHEDRETIGRSMNMSQDQIEYLSSLSRGFAAIYSEGDNRPKCVKLPLMIPQYEKSRNEVIREVKNKVNNIASGYDIIFNHHAGCPYCEKKCMYFEDTKRYVEQRVSVQKVVEKWRERKYLPEEFVNFLNTELMKALNLTDDNHKRCVIGFILTSDEELNRGQQQEKIASYLKYIFERRG